MDDRGHLAQMLLAALPASRRAAGHCVLDDGAESGALDVALPRAALAGMPGALGRFCREFDLKLVQLLERPGAGWHAVLAWSDDIGRPRFLNAELHCDWYRGGTLLLRGAELLAPQPGVRFVHALLRNLWRRDAWSDAEARRLSALREEAPRGALEQAARFFQRPADLRLVSQAARLGNWSQVSAHRGRLRRAARRAARYPLRSAAAALARLGQASLRPARAAIAFVGPDDARREAVRQAVLRDLAPAFPEGPATLAYRPADEHWGVDLRIVLGDAAHAAKYRNAVLVGAAQPLPAVVGAAERAILDWMESRVERRFPEALVGRNPPAARLLQWSAHRRVPWLASAVQTLLNCDIECDLRAPVLMPHPYGIVIERGTRIGNRVTIMQQATLAAGATGAPVVEENVTIGPGARILGGVRIGRNAVIGANAVVTGDVPSHCTVQAGALSPQPDVARQRSVVNS
jgi:serine acetyltransferase